MNQMLPVQGPRSVDRAARAWVAGDDLSARYDLDRTADEGYESKRYSAMASSP